MRQTRITLRHTAAGVLMALLLPAAALAVGLPGDPAADFTLTDTNGVVHSLSDYDGKVRFLNFFGHS
jgi:hypothetical protein